MSHRDHDVKKKRLIENLSWAAFILLVGLVLIMPGDTPDGTWYLFIGLILIAMNIGKLAMNIPVSFLTLGSGIVLSIAGMAEYLGVDVPLGPVILIIVAVLIMIRSFYKYSRK